MGVALWMAIDGKPIQQPKLTQRIDILLHLMKAEDSFNEAVKIAIDKIPSVSTDKSQVSTLMEKFFSYKSLRPRFVELFSKIYTLQEINAMIRFYSTPAGKSIISKEKKLLEGVIEIVQTQFAVQMPQIIAWLGEQQQQLRAMIGSDEVSNEIIRPWLNRNI
ncbi:unnamed protein product [Adineta ricciae]|uniref:DUF2059 domain-containing protein n=1 Tax=Adineta ricciae TaxID=249248 RepID=A0A815XBS1_ADIRI|nr:unnamed protein product [Adineta ricciae]